MADTFESSIPKSLFDDIVAHILSKCRRWRQRSWDSSKADEDALSGDFWGKFDKQEVNSTSYSGWDWDMSYSKLGGRGKNALEKRSGADGIFEINVWDDFGKLIFQKSFLFQAKMRSSFSPSTTSSQAKRMERIAKNGSVIIVYGKDGFSAIQAHDYLNNLGSKSYATSDVCDYIVEQFFKCRHGKKDLSYDSDKKEIVTDSGAIPARLQDSIKLTIHKKY